MDHQPSFSSLKQPMIDLKVDISGKVEGLPGSVFMAASLYLPSEEILQQYLALPLLVMVHGASYTRRYWDLVVPGYERDAYNCAGYLAQRGNVVLTFDTLGMGESQNGLNGHHLTTAMMSAGLVAATESIKRQLADGTLLGGTAVTIAFSVLIGHSMGAYLSVLTQHQHRAFDVLIVQGHTCGKIVLDIDALLAIPPDEHGYIYAPRSVTHSFFHGSFPPPADVIAADDRLEVSTPINLFREGAISLPKERVAQIDVPVLVALAQEDPIENLHEEPSYYTSAPSCSLYIQPEAAHCGNFASTRQQLWQAVADFVLRALL